MSADEKAEEQLWNFFEVLKCNPKGVHQRRIFHVDPLRRVFTNYEKEKVQKSFPFKKINAVIKEDDPLAFQMDIDGNSAYRCLSYTELDRNMICDRLQEGIDKLKDDYQQVSVVAGVTIKKATVEEMKKEEKEKAGEKVDEATDKLAGASLSTPENKSPTVSRSGSQSGEGGGGAFAPVYRATVEKRGKHSWAARYVLVFRGRLFVMREKGAPVPLNVVDLGGASVSCPEDKKLFLVALHCQARAYTFKCKTAGERDEMRDALKSCVLSRSASQELLSAGVPKKRTASFVEKRPDVKIDGEDSDDDE